MKKLATIIGITVLALGLAVPALAHSPICTCYDNGDGSVTCEGGFSDGSSAAGVNMYVMQGKKALIKGAMNADSEFTFKKPQGGYQVKFDAGAGHAVEINGKDIVE